MKLGCIYTVFNGLELLDGSIKNIYHHVDEIVIVYQELSNRGNFDGNVYNRLKKYEQDFKVHLVPFTPNMALNTKENELNKHNVGLEAVRNLGCSHFMLSACDHYYHPIEFQKAKEFLEEDPHDVSITAMYTYYKEPTLQLTPIEEYFMPLICRLYPDTKYTKDQWAFRVDPSVRTNRPGKDQTYIVFAESKIMMHHFSMIRQDIRNKFDNASAGIRWDAEKIQRFISEYENHKEGDELEYFGGRRTVRVPNYFNI